MHRTSTLGRSQTPRGRRGSSPSSDALHSDAGDLSFRLLLFVCALTPLPFGAVEAWWIAVFCVPAALALLTLRVGALERVTRRRLAAFLVVCALVAFVFVLHLIAWVPTPGQAVLRETAPLLGIDPGTAAPGTVAVVRAAGSMLLGGLVFATALGHGQNRDVVFRLVWVVAVSAAAWALLTAVQHAVEPGRLLWTRKSAYLEYFTGTFVNRNTAAAYFGVGLLCWIALLLREIDRVRRRVGDDLTAVVRAAVGGQFRRFALLGAGLSVLLVTLIATGSRAGVALTMGAAFLVLLLYVVRTRLPVRFAYLMVGAAVLYLVVLVELNGGMLFGRIAARDVGGDERWIAYQATWHIVLDYPWAGIGPGYFASVFPLYRPPELGVQFVWDSAHSTPLQLLAELGIPVGGALCLWWAYVVIALARGSMTRRNVLLPIVGLGVALLGLIHTSIDFSLEVPGFAAVFFALTGAALGQTVARPERRVPD